MKVWIQVYLALRQNDDSSRVKHSRVTLIIWQDYYFLLYIFKFSRTTLGWFLMKIPGDHFNEWEDGSIDMKLIFSSPLFLVQEIYHNQGEKFSK